MSQAAKEVKRAAVDLLDGSLTYNSVNVPVWDGKVEEEVPVFVLVDIVNHTTENSTFDMEVNDMDLVFDVVSIRESTVKSEVLEDVHQQIKALINPTKNTHALEIASPFRVVQCEFRTASEDNVTEVADKLSHSKRSSYQTVVIKQ